MSRKQTRVLTAPLLTGEGNIDDEGYPIMGQSRKKKSHLVTEQSRNQIAEMSAYGLTQEQICGIMGISKNVLEKNYRHELDTAIARKNAMVANNLFNRAIGDGSDAVKAAIFWLQQRGGEEWRRASRTELSGPNGAPLQVAQARTIDSRQLSYEDRQALREIMLRATNGESEQNVIEHEAQEPEEESEETDE